MQRDITRKLATWKDSRNRKPLILQGARQVGKTWAVKDFARTHFQGLAYVNLLDDDGVKNAFEGELDPNRILEAIAIRTGAQAGNPDVLVVLDEVQESPRALTSLKQFAEQRPDVPVIAAGSLLGVALHRGASFPVGKVDHLTLYPMTFYEYLMAAKPNMCGAVERRDCGLLDAFAESYTSELRKYMFVGGMPEAVQAFIDTGSYDEARSVQNRLLYDYEHDFSKYAAPQLSEKIRMLWSSLPAQLGRDNKKFIYSAVRKGARARGYEEAIQWLADAGLVLKVNKISKPGLPLASYEDREAFKLYLFDTGLLGAASRLSTSTLLDGDALFTEFKGALTENYVCQQLFATDLVKPCYWASENSSGEVDFVYDYEGQVVPLEVKAALNLRSKSLRSFLSKFDLDHGLRLSLAGFDEQDWVTNIPLYAANVLPGWALQRGSGQQMCF